MTNKEALKILDTIPTIGEQVDALEIAIKALEQEPCEDAISREETLHAMCANCDDWQTCKMGCQRRKSILALPPVNLEKKEDTISRQAVLKCFEFPNTKKNDFITAIKDLPPVNPVKTGHWIAEEEKEGLGNCRCSVCDRYYYATGKMMWNYCPNCGAKMEDNNADCD